MVKDWLVLLPPLIYVEEVQGLLQISAIIIFMLEAQVHMPQENTIIKEGGYHSEVMF